MKRVTFILLVLYALLSAYVVLSQIFPLFYTPLFTPLLTILAFTFAVLHATQRMGWARAFLLLFLTFGVSLLFECVGVATGLIYGPYHYTDKLGWKFLDLVPLLIPLAWFMMSYPSWVIATRLLPSGWPAWSWRLGAAALGGITMTAWDLAMDPLMVSGGHWVWEQTGAYFGIPLQNYWGWWLTIFVAFLVYTIVSHATPSPAVRQLYTYDRQAVISYAVTGSSSVLIGFAGGLPGPALVGLFAMIPWVITALLTGKHVQAIEKGVPAHATYDHVDQETVDKEPISR
jgi:putative membrane protein